ncbi:MAG TPA: HAD-IA family hydrolase [Candidatus Faecousia excrementigallinarum]|uniref:HAD-IA family hydrolase n=1 Tax=Candidatus Faecousia excrementigallinarum TaxID=2840806 RepID=A0A9D0Z2Z1_9FIRM|nr:HAD-IA family hydrolase [Candidatus Faecousia excrementigallinarum]
MEIAMIFDLDGTLLDTLEDLQDAVNYALTQFGYPERTLEEVRQFVGEGAGKLMERAVPKGADPEPVLSCFRTYYAAHTQVKTRPYPGIPEALEALGKKYPLAVVSNKPDEAVKILGKAYFPSLYARGEAPDCPRKPNAAMVHKTMEALGVQGCIYIGDSQVDVETAKNAGVPCLSVTWGFRDLDCLRSAGATHFCHAPEDLPRMLETMKEEYYGQ